jgi:hypothetical protein
VTSFDDPVLLAVAVLDGDDSCRNALWDACGHDPRTYSHTLVAAQHRRRTIVGHETPPEPSFVEPRRLVRAHALAPSRSPLPVTPFDGSSERRPAPAWSTGAGHLLDVVAALLVACAAVVILIQLARGG